MKKKIVLVANTAWYLVNFRLSVIEQLGKNWDVVCVSPADGWEKKLPCSWVEWDLSRRSINPLSEIGAILCLHRILRQLSPDLVHFFTVKPVVYGTLAAYFLEIPHIVNSVTGLGHLFLSDRKVILLVRKLVERFYRAFALSPKVHFIFQNATDQQLYIERGYCAPSQATLIPGSGVDTKKFSYKKMLEPTGQVLFLGRLIREKGLDEVFLAAKLLWTRKSRARFLIAGEIDPGNPSSYSKEEIAQQASPNMEFLGHVDNVHDLLQRAEILILPSYREGFPRSVLEAFASGVPVVATDVPGCNALVNRESGILIPPRDGLALAEAISFLLDDRAAQEEFRKKGRALVEEKYSSEIILRQTQKIYRDLMDPNPTA